MSSFLSLLEPSTVLDADAETLLVLPFRVSLFSRFPELSWPQLFLGCSLRLGDPNTFLWLYLLLRTR